jgi:hypothetical protein
MNPALRSIFSARSYFEDEARALLTRVNRVRPFAIQETMVPAAGLERGAQLAIEYHLIAGRNRVRRMIRNFMRRLRESEGHLVPEVVQRQFTIMRLRFNASLTQLDIFADALSQRSERDTGLWLAGLDVAARDGLRLKGDYYETPPLICYLDRGQGAAIRRAKTRLPGGDQNPVSVIRVPRERMIGAGIGSSLFHEVGHQAAALLDLVESVRLKLRRLQQGTPDEREAWAYWDRCISEILADHWSIARIGIGSTLGLIGVVTLPSYFVFRFKVDDPHPVPWIRVKLSCAIGRALYPHKQWETLERLWEDLYPPSAIPRRQRDQFAMLEKTMPALASLLANHRPRSLRGAALSEVLGIARRRPEELMRVFREWQRSPAAIRRAPPTLVFAVIGQARFDGALSPEREGRMLNSILKHWALRSALEVPIRLEKQSNGNIFRTNKKESNYAYQ